MLNAEPRVAIVSGSSGDLGTAIVAFLVSKGISVVGFDLNAPAAMQNKTHEYVRVDLTDEAQTKQAVDYVDSKYGQINILINAAGLIHSKALINLTGDNELRHSIESFRHVIEVNLTSTFLLGSLVSEKMLNKRVQGRIVNVSSISAKGPAGQSAYASAKAGVEALTKVWAKELGGFGITVNAISPGYINTPSTERALSVANLQQIRGEIPIRRLGSVDNICQGIEYLICNDYANGSILAVDGGMVV